MSDYELLDKLVRILGIINRYDDVDLDELKDIAEDYLTGDELDMLANFSILKTKV